MTDNRQPQRRRWSALLLAMTLLAFVAGLVWLLKLRLDTSGDVYPVYSSFRSDPLGTKALYEALGELRGLRVERNLRPLELLGTVPLHGPDFDNGENTFACLVLGEPPSQWPFLLTTADAGRLEDIMRRGGRVIMTFDPTARVPPAKSSYDPTKFRAPGASPGSTPGPVTRRIAQQNQLPDLSKRWGIDFRRDEAAASPTPTVHRTRKSAPASPAAESTPGIGAATPALPEAALKDSIWPSDREFASETSPIPWHSVVDFEERYGTGPIAPGQWRPLLRRGGRPVMMAKSFGKAGGELILASDTFFLSDEGLRAAAHPALLSALIGPAQQIFFDESHLGVTENPGVMTLARRYRLGGGLGVLALLAGLFIWRRMAGMPGVASGQAAEEPTRGYATGSGYVNLLRRSVPLRDLPAMVAAQWQRTNGAQSVELSSQIAAIAARPLGRRTSVADLYRGMCDASRAKR